MRPLVSLTLYICFVMAGGALLAPLLYHLAQWAAHSSSFWQEIATQPFHRFVNRAMLILAFVGLIPFLRQIGIRSWRDVGLVKPQGQGRHFGAGFLLGFLSLAVIVTGQMMSGARRLDTEHGVASLVTVAAAAALPALFVGFMEELLFRGGLYGAWRRSYSGATAVVISSAAYALVHFFQKPPRPAQVEWWTGFITLGEMLRGFVDLDLLVPGFLCLTVAGGILALGYQRTGTLYFSIGLHAGWVFWLGFYGKVTNGNGKAFSSFWGSRRLIDGWATMLLLICLLLAFLLWERAAAKNR